MSCLKEVSLPQLMKASGVFGRGMGGRRMKKILDRYPNILVEEDSSANRIEKIYEIKGFRSIKMPRIVLDLCISERYCQ